MSAPLRETRIERLHAANAGLLDSVAPDVFDNAVDPMQLAAFAADARHMMYLAIHDDTVVGMVSGVEYFHPDKKPQLWINELGVAAAHRRRGIGRLLVQSVLGEAKDRGCVCAWLGTDLDNAPAQQCFEAVGGERAKTPFLLYEWELPAG